MNIPLTINTLKQRSLGHSSDQVHHAGKFNLGDYETNFSINSNNFNLESENEFLNKAFSLHSSANSPSELLSKLDFSNLDLMNLSLGELEPHVDSLGFSIMDLNKFTFNSGLLSNSEAALLPTIREQLFQVQTQIESCIRKALADPNLSTEDKQKLEKYLANIKTARESQAPNQTQQAHRLNLGAWANAPLNTFEQKKLSEQGIELLKKTEGFSAKAYSDYSQHTNGYGTKAAYAGENIDPQTAELRLKEDLKHREVFINRVAAARLEKTGKGMSQAQFDSLTMMVFNLGLGQAHEVHQAVIDGKDELVPKLMNKYVHAGGNVLPGLVSRRAEEGKLYNYGSEQLNA